MEFADKHHNQFKCSRRERKETKKRRNRKQFDISSEIQIGRGEEKQA